MSQRSVTTEGALAGAPSAPPRRRGSRRRQITGTLFSAPWLASLALLLIGPIFASLYYSFTDASLVGKAKWVGLDNYERLARDKRFLKSVTNTLWLLVVGVPLQLGIGLLCALALNFKVRGQALYRAVMYLPVIVPVVSSAYVWRWMLNAQYGTINQVLGWFGINGPDWLGDPIWTRPAVLMIMIWGIGGTIIIFLAALKDVPQELYEAATVDGAGTLGRFRHVTLPMISPVMLFQLIMGIIGYLQLFAPTFLLTQSRLNPASGGPDNSLLTLGVSIFHNAFVFLRMGYASAMAWVLLVVTALVTAVVMGTQGRWVHYGQR